jgi:hypothetical protein
MGQVFRSGAFLQQCWSVHPLCLAVRRITGENQLALACTACRFAHYVTIGSIVLASPGAAEESARSADSSEARSEPQMRLARCIEAHPTALSLRGMDVFEDVAIIRCGECRRQYTLAATAFETHQK